MYSMSIGCRKFCYLVVLVRESQTTTIFLLINTVNGYIISYFFYFEVISFIKQVLINSLIMFI